MTDSFVSQFGKTLYSSSTDSHTTPSSALTGKDYVMLYFSAKWCPPCRRFTPMLIEFYNKIKTTKNVELVFCSLDKEEDEYKEYTSKMPWLSMPFEAGETKVMAGKYGARGIPHLVVIDGKTGEVITKDGTENVGEDGEGLNFPWKPKTFNELWPSKILPSKTSGGENLQSDTLKDKYLMLYFSAHWCPPCRAFTPKLSEAYTKLKAKRDDFELVFVSSDRDEAAFKEYHDTMSFCALPYELRDEKKGLSKLFEVSGIPKLIILGPVSEETGDRPLINDNVRSFIDSDDLDAFPFHKRNYGTIDSADDIEDVKTVVLFHENGDDEEQEEIKTIAKDVAAKLKEDGKEINVRWALKPDGLGNRIRNIVQLKMTDDPAMMMLDIPSDGAYYLSDVTDITVDSVVSFIESPGTRKQL